MHVRHRDDRNAADLKAALCAAEAAVKEKLGYTIALTEKPLFDYSSAIPNRTMEAAVSAATEDEEACDSDDEGLTEERGRRMYERNEGPPSPHPCTRRHQRGMTWPPFADADASCRSRQIRQDLLRSSRSQAVRWRCTNGRLAIAMVQPLPPAIGTQSSPRRPRWAVWDAQSDQQYPKPLEGTAMPPALSAQLH